VVDKATSSSDKGEGNGRRDDGHDFLRGLLKSRATIRKSHLSSWYFRRGNVFEDSNKGRLGTRKNEGV